MEVFTVKATDAPGTRTHSEAQQIIVVYEDGPQYRITPKQDGTLSIREVSYLNLTLRAETANAFTVGAQ